MKMPNIFLACVPLLICCHLHMMNAAIETHETRLHRDLFKVNRHVTPAAVEGKGKKIKVVIGLTMNQVVDVVSSKSLFCSHHEIYQQRLARFNKVKGEIQEDRKMCVRPYIPHHCFCHHVLKAS